MNTRVSFITHILLASFLAVSLSLSLSGCENDLLPMTIVPIKYAPVKVISGSSSNSTINSFLKPEVPDPVGCWEQTPAEEGKPLIRRWYIKLPTGNWDYASGRISRDEPPKTTQDERYKVTVGKTNITLPYPILRREVFQRNDDLTLTIDGRVFRRLPELEPMLDSCLPGLE